MKRGHGPEGVQIVLEKALGSNAPIPLCGRGVVISATIGGDHEPKLGIFPGKQTGIAPLEQGVTLNMQKQSRTRVKCGSMPC